MKSTFFVSSKAGSIDTVDYFYNGCSQDYYQLYCLLIQFIVIQRILDS